MWIRRWLRDEAMGLQRRCVCSVVRVEYEILYSGFLLCEWDAASITYRAPRLITGTTSIKERVM